MAPEAYPRETHAVAVARLLDRYQLVLGLRDWDIRFDPTPPSPDARAEIDGWAMKRMASIRIAPDAPVEALPRLVVHELLHLWLAQLEDLARPLMEHTPTQADASFTSAWDRMEHQFIHVLEGALTGDAHLEWGEGTPDWTKPWQREWQDRQRGLRVEAPEGTIASNSVAWATPDPAPAVYPPCTHAECVEALSRWK